jgi:hypothetical protein
MFFQVIHSHSEETCPGVFPDKLATFGAWWNEMKNTPGVKVLGGFVSPIEHNFYITLEADDFGMVARALGPLNTIGTGSITPVVTLDQAIPMADAGAFRPRP